MLEGLTLYIYQEVVSNNMSMILHRYCPLIVLSTLLFIGGKTSAQTTEPNFIRVYKAKVPLTGDVSTVSDMNQVVESTGYYDGLGRPAQSVQEGASPIGHNIIQPIAYDEF